MNLNLLQNRRGVQIARGMLDVVAEDFTFIKCIVTGDEYDVELSNNLAPKMSRNRKN